MLTLVKLHAHAFQHTPCYQLNKQRHVLLLICRHNINYLEGEKKPNFTPCKKDSVFQSLLVVNFSSQASKSPIYRISLPYNHNKALYLEVIQPTWASYLLNTVQKHLPEGWNFNQLQAPLTICQDQRPTSILHASIQPSSQSCEAKESTKILRSQSAAACACP